MLTYCLKQKKQTACLPGSETFLVTKNGRNAMKCVCSECGATKFRFIKGQNGEGLGDILGTFTGSLLKSGTDQLTKVYDTAPRYQLYRLLVPQEGGSFDELIVKGLAAGAKGLFNLGRRGAARAIKSDFTRKKIKQVGQKYLDGVVDSVTSDISQKIDPRHGGAVDIHKAIGKLPKPKGGWTLPGHKYTGPYNDLENQVRCNPETGEILEIYDPPTGKTDAIAMQHDVDYSVCGDDKKCKHLADRKMVKALDAVPWNERQWGHWLARNAINTKQKVGLGVGASPHNPRQAKKVKKKTTQNHGKRS